MCSHTRVDHAAAPTSLIFAGRCRFGVSQAYQQSCWQCRRVVCRQSLRGFEGDIMGALTMSPAPSTSALRGRWLLRQHAFGAAGGFCAAVTASVLQPQPRGCRRSSSLRQRLCSSLDCSMRLEPLDGGAVAAASGGSGVRRPWLQHAFGAASSGVGAAANGGCARAAALAFWSRWMEAVAQ